LRQVRPIPPFVFDNDCLASFLWTRRVDILVRVLPERRVVPGSVVSELEVLAGGPYNWVYEQLVEEINGGRFEKAELVAETPEALEFRDLVFGQGFQGRRLGRGEAAALLLAKSLGGTVASNNLKDVAEYCKRYGLNLISTDDILCVACNRGYLTVEEGNELWAEMKRRRRRLPDYDFFEAYRRFEEGLPK